MYTLNDIISRTPSPTPWSEGDNIPWDDPGFSRRMLAEHLTQDHDLASRRAELIDSHVATIVAAIPPAPGRVLDLACGPGLYLNRLTRLGYAGLGIDFSPASIEYALAHSGEAEYRLADLRTTGFGSGFDAALLLYGQLNVFRRSEAREILGKAHDALQPGGTLVLEPQTADHIRAAGQADPGWSAHEEGLFSDRPHLLLTESFWDEPARTATQRFHVVDAESGSVQRHAMSNVAYTEAELSEMLGQLGFVEMRVATSLTGEPRDDGLFALFATA
ncbi:MAG: class I SAM-dependent methyltransferase [Acidimicrobiia bacterium]|nr:class I SAM-dependent methyltransferase [Acidimicrobiia bacterium]